MAAIAAAAGLAAVYGIAGLAGNPQAPAVCTAARAAVQRVAPLAHGEVAALTVASNPQLLPNLAFRDAAGQPKSLADWRGRTVLLNLWATWCVPCRKEMPALDALQAKLGGENFEVVAVNIDTRDPAKPQNWLREAGVNRLAYYADPSAKVFQDLKAAGKAFGMPTTVLVAPSGCEIGSLAGPAEWASDDAVKLIEAALRG
ncbi:MAG TPA: TlpA disulfide reductase family protein [Xanthobacteraceae bacterium]|nr:TlpA disulfide reductase family protein [Xanthobacteraceae bacterium]